MTGSRTTAERLVEVAGEIFARSGPKATVREICGSANCSVAAINYHFGDKAELYRQCVAAAVDRKLRLFPTPRVEDSCPAPVLLREFLRAITNRMTSPENLPWQNTLMLREVLSPSEGVKLQLQEAFSKDFEALSEIVGRLLDGCDCVNLRQEFTLQIVARCMFLRTGSNLREILGLVSDRTEDPQQYADSICESVIHQVNSIRRLNGIEPLSPESTKGILEAGRI